MKCILTVAMLLPLLALTSSASAADFTDPLKASGPRSFMIKPYAEGSHFELLTAPGQITEISMEAGERIQSIAAGDTARWTIAETLSGSGADEKTHVLIKPLSAGLSTNLLIMTDRRVYRLYLTSREGRGMSGLRWTYPQDNMVRNVPPRQVPQCTSAISSGIAIEKLNFNYVISGDVVLWRPLRAFDDGRQTWIEFSDNLHQGAAPPLFLVGDSGKPELVNYRVTGRFYVVDRLFQAAELRMGTKPQKIVQIRQHAVPSNAKGEKR